MDKPKGSRRVVTQAAMRRARSALERDGLPFAGYRIRPDGSVDVLVNPPTEPAPIPADPGLAEIEAWKKRHGYA
jgi:hypothetical protein